MMTVISEGIFNPEEFYNPIINLKWSDKDKIWMNHKIYTDKFEKIYPDLIPQDIEKELLIFPSLLENF